MVFLYACFSNAPLFVCLQFVLSGLVRISSLISTQKILSEIFRAKFFLEKSFRSSISTLVKYSCEILSEEKLPRPIPESKQT